MALPARELFLNQPDDTCQGLHVPNTTSLLHQDRGWTAPGAPKSAKFNCAATLFPVETQLTRLPGNVFPGSRSCGSTKTCCTDRINYCMKRKTSHRSPKSLPEHHPRVDQTKVRADYVHALTHNMRMQCSPKQRSHQLVLILAFAVRDTVLVRQCTSPG